MSGPDAEFELPPIARCRLSLFFWWTKWMLWRRFEAVRILPELLPVADTERPLLIVLTHPSWWDPITALHLGTAIWPTHEHRAPMDNASLEKQRWMARIGIFGVEKRTIEGVKVFDRYGSKILGSAQQALWVTAQGEFTDPRERPIRIARGCATLLARHCRRENAEQSPPLVYPLAIEYLFWDQPRPELLTAFGPRLSPSADLLTDREAWQAELTGGLEQTADRLAAAARSRDAKKFITLQELPNIIREQQSV